MTRKASAPAILTLGVSMLMILIALAGPAVAQNPVPLLDQPLVPDTAAPGGAGFTLTVNGAWFLPTSVVNWNGSPRATAFVSSSKLTATILASDIATASTATVTVVNPSPGGGVSNIQDFSIAVHVATLSFLPEQTYSAGAFATEFVATADVNGDGIPDLVVAIQNCPGGTCSNDGMVGVLLGKGDGSFQPPVLYDSGGKWADCVAVADLNGDGIPDIVVTNSPSNSSTVGVLLGNGDGTFQPAMTHSAGGIYVAVADVNGDGKPDLITKVDGCCVEVLLGNGDGTFQTGVEYRANGVGSIAVTDLNGDGIPDLVVAGAAQDGDTDVAVVLVLLGNGDGTFQPNVSYPTGSSVGNSTYSAAVADVNGDGKPDIVAANYVDGTVGVLLGNGDGTFQPVVVYGAGRGDSFSVTLADMNGDGKLDIVVGNIGSVGVLAGKGDGTFREAVSFSGGGDTLNVAAADLNGDGRPDLLASDGGLDISVLLNDSGPQSSSSTTLTSSLNPSVYGQSVTFAATVSSTSGTPTGTVVLYNGSAGIGSGTLASGKTSMSLSSLPAGSDSITASYQGSATFAPSTSAPVNQIVSAASTSVALTSSLNPAGTGQTVNLTATVSSLFGGATTGTVTYFSGSQTLGTASLSGTQATLATSFAATGTYSITAHYNGDANNLASTSATLNQTIISSTTTALTSSSNPALIGQTITFTATVTSTSGTPPNGEIVTFNNGSAILGTAALTGGVASFAASLPAGVYSMTANYPGDANFAASTSTVLRQVVNSTTKSATSTALVSNLNPSIYGQSVTWTSTVSGTGQVIPTGTVAFTWSGHTIGTAKLNANGVATLTRSKLNADSYPLTAVYSGDANNLGSTSAILNQVIEPTTSSAALTSSPNPSAPGEAVTFTAKITSPTIVPSGPVTFTAGKTLLGTAQLSNGKAKFTISTLAAGSATVTVTYSGDSNIAPSSASVVQTVQ